MGAQQASVAPAAKAYVRRVIDRRDGLPESQVNAIAQSADGYFWLATRRGLVRYDGLSFKLYEPGNTPGLPAPWINEARFDARQRLWLATAGGLAVREDNIVRRVDTTQVPAVDVWSTLEDSRGALWVATEDGVFVGDGRRFVPVPKATGFAYALAKDSRGRMWMAGRGWMAYAEGDSLVDVTARLGIRGRVFSLLVDGPDRIWAATQRGATEVLFDSEGTPRIGRQISTRIGSREVPVWTIAKVGGALWLGTETRGTLWFDGARLRSMSAAPLETWSLFEDRNGVIWAGTGSGLERYQQSAFTTLSAGLPDSPVWATRIAPWGELWAAVENGSVHRLTGDRFSPVLNPSPYGISVPVLADGDGMLVADRGRTLLRVEANGRRAALPSGGPPVGVLLGLHKGNNALWVSADSGLFQLTDGRMKPMNGVLGLPPGARPREMSVDSAGRLYFGRPWLTTLTGATARRFGPRDGLTSSEVRAILHRGEYTWLGTRDSGLYVMHGDSIRALGAFDDRLKREILGLGADDQGYLWLSWSYGLFRVPFSDLEAAATGRATRVRVRSFDPTEGLATGSFRGDFQSALPRDHSGALYAPNASGVVRIDPRLVAADTVAPAVVIESIVVDGKPVPPSGALTLRTGVGRVEFTLATPGALRPTEVRLQYRLVGVDTLWLDGGDRRTIAFGPLRGGTYRFEARAATEESNWSVAPITTAISVDLSLTEHRWFLPLLLMTTGGLVVLLTRARRVALERQARSLATQVADRTADLEAERQSLERRVGERTAELARELARRERLQHALADARKLEGLGRLAGGVAHEINNGMTSVLGFAELATMSASSQPELLSDLEQVRRAGERITAIVRQLLQFARRQQSDRAPVDVGSLVASLQRSLDALLGDGIMLHLQVAEQLHPVNADSAQLEQVLVNLVVNARDAMPDGGRVEVDVRNCERHEREVVGGEELDAGSYVVLTVRDTGRGIDAATRGRLFEPFFTTKGRSSGTGLGLAVSHGIVVGHGGAISVESGEGRGAAFAIWLPAAPDFALAREALPSDVAHGARNGETILLVDDDAAIRQIVRRHLTHAGYRVLVAANGHQALDIAAKGGESIDLVISDVRMPDLDGLAFARSLRSHHGPCPVMFLTGSAGYEPDNDVRLAEFGPIIPKPVSRDRLQALVRELLDAQRQQAGIG